MKRHGGDRVSRIDQVTVRPGQPACEQRGLAWQVPQRAARSYS